MELTLRTLDAAELASSPQFARVAREVYRDDPHWAAPSEAVIAERARDAVEGRIHLHGVVALAGDRPVARAAAIVEPAAVAPSGARQGWIGLFECREDARQAGVAVLSDRRRWLRDRGLTEISAPRSDALRGGLLTSGFDEPHVVLTPYNPAYYPEVFAAAGFVPSTRMVGYRFSRDRAPRIPVPAGLGLRVRPVDPNDWAGEVARLHAFQETVFANRAARVPRPPDGTGLLADRLRQVIDPDLCLIAEDAKGRTVGVLLCLPDVWQQRPAGASPDRARLLSIGLLPGWRGRGAALAMGAALAEQLLGKGYQSLEASWVRGDNVRPQRLARALGAVPSRGLTIYDGSGPP
ncbi:MAG: GNAT family N-acetyltransferase [Kineosporiaceae bacterium]|jgi:GNAT superfamily N-acetyltransferase